MKRIVEITLIENSTAGNPPKIFAAQTVEITHVPDTVQKSTDGIFVRGRHPSAILWVGGTTKDLYNISDVKMVGDDDEVLIDGELNIHNGGPYEVIEGVKFFVLKPD